MHGAVVGLADVARFLRGSLEMGASSSGNAVGTYALRGQGVFNARTRYGNC